MRFSIPIYLCVFQEQIVLQTFLKQLPKVLEDLSNPEAQMHAAGTLRNLAAGDLVRVSHWQVEFCSILYTRTCLLDRQFPKNLLFG